MLKKKPGRKGTVLPELVDRKILTNELPSIP